MPTLPWARSCNGSGVMRGRRRRGASASFGRCWWRSSRRSRAARFTCCCTGRAATTRIWWCPATAPASTGGPSPARPIVSRALQARAGEAVIGVFGLQPCPSWATRSRNNASCEPMVPRASYASVETLADTQWSLKSALPCLPGQSLPRSSLLSVVSRSRRGR